MDLTQKQYELYIAIIDYIKEYGYSPTIRELCRITEVSSPATTFSKLKALKRKGYITYVDKKSRTIKILKEIEKW